MINNDISNVDISNVDISNVDISNVDISNVDISNVDISRNFNDYTPFLNIIKTNFIFYIVLFICLYFISKYTNHSYLNTILSLFIASFLGYFIHFLSHQISFTKFYSSSNNYITNSKYLNPILLKIVHFLDFHDITHHNTNINKQTENIFYEFLNNLVTQGLFAVFFVFLVKKINMWTFLLWAFLYATTHNINYYFLPPTRHINHHKNKFTNYGLMFEDLLLNTESNIFDIENYNHVSINLIILTGLICIITRNFEI